MFNIDKFISNGLVKGGARPSLFKVTLTAAPASAPALEKFEFTCRATSAPASTVGPVPVPYFGREIKLAGDRTFADWDVTVMNDEDFLVRDTMENWHNSINTIVSNIRVAPNNSYKGTAVITQFSKSGVPIKGYELRGIFPLNVGDMPLDWETQNQIQTFGVTFAYDYWVPVKVTSGVNINVNATA